MGRIKDLTGQRFGMLTVIKMSDIRKHRYVCWECRCDCGNTTVVIGTHLTSGNTRSCGRHAATGKNNGNYEHGLFDNELYKRWQSVKTRCYNPNSNSYPNYGGRGIKVCEEWKGSFEAFYEWAMENGYEKGLQIDRVDNDGNYEPSNCRWITSKENYNNRRTSHYVTIEDETKTIAQWCEIYKIKDNVVRARISRGWDKVKAITTPVRRN